MTCRRPGVLRHDQRRLLRRLRAGAAAPRRRAPSAAAGAAARRRPPERADARGTVGRAARRPHRLGAGLVDIPPVPRATRRPR